MSPRAIPEWIGATPDAKVPARVRLRIWRRQCGGNNFIVCPLSGAILRSASECDLDHEVALIDNGEHREGNLRFVQKAAHREKTAAEVARKAHVDATAKRHLGLRARGPLAGADADERAARRKARSADRAGNKLAIPSARALYQEIG